MRFVVVFLYQGMILEEAYDALSWDQAYETARSEIGPKPKIQAIYLVERSTSKLLKLEDYEQLQIYITGDKK